MEFFYRSLAAPLQGGRKAEVALRLPNSTDALLLSGKKEPLSRGEGLLFYGNVILPFVDRFPKDLELYSYLTTKLSEVTAAKEG